MRRAQLIALPPLVARRDAAQATLDRFVGHLHRWGQVDCVRVAAFHLRQLGYRPQLARGGQYANELGAVRALKRAGFDHPHAALGALGLKEIGFASHLVGDIMSLRSAGDWPALAVCLSNGRILTSTQDHPAFGVLTPAAGDILTCWRCDPCLTP